jgi:protein ImuB
VEVVKPGVERTWLAALPVAALAPDARLATLLDGVGIRTLGELASLDREAVEVRLGAEAVSLWRLARADDRRLLFGPVPPERPHGSIDFVDYVLTDPARLLFTANALLGPLCDRLVARGEHARALRLVLPLANGETWERTLRPARPTASRESWLRMVRGLLDRLTVPDAVTGMLIEVGATEPAAVRQGDLFDRGFATAAAVEAAVARLVERQVVPLTPRANDHPLAERRTRWEPLVADRVASGGAGQTGAAARGSVGLSLQLLPEPPTAPSPSGMARARRRRWCARRRSRGTRRWV